MAFSRRDHATVGVVDVRKVVEAALTLRRYHLARDRVNVVVDAPADGSCLVAADAHYLQQVLVNLIINAEQAVRGREGPALRCAVAVDCRPRRRARSRTTAAGWRPR